MILTYLRLYVIATATYRRSEGAGFCLRTRMREEGTYRRCGRLDRSRLEAGDAPAMRAGSEQIRVCLLGRDVVGGVTKSSLVVSCLAHFNV